jgi:hypothetical protein
MGRAVGLVLVQAPRPHLIELGQVDARQRRVSGYNAVVGIQRQAGIDKKVADA